MLCERIKIEEQTGGEKKAVKNLWSKSAIRGRAGVGKTEGGYI